MERKTTSKYTGMLLALVLAIATVFTSAAAFPVTAFADETAEQQQNEEQASKTSAEQPAETPETKAQKETQAKAKETKETQAPETKAEPETTKPAHVDLQEDFSLEDGNYYVDIALVEKAEEDADDADWSAVIENNGQALVTVKSGKVTKVDFATNPAHVGSYESAVTKMKVNDTDIKAEKTAAFTTLPADNDISYILHASFTLPDSAQPEKKDSVTFVPVKLLIPDITKDEEEKDTWQEAFLQFTWESAQSSEDKEVKPDTTIATDDGSAILNANPAVVKVKQDASVSLKVKVVNGTDKGKGYTYTYTSDKADIAAVSDGKITGVAEGKAVITITAEKKDETTLTRKVKVTVEKKEAPKTYAIAVSASEGGKAEASEEVAEEGEEITLIATPDDGYTFKEWQVVEGGVTVSDNKFTVGKQDVEIKAIFEKVPAATYTVTTSKSGKGTVSADPTSGAEGTKVTIKAEAATGYKFSKWSVVSGSVKLANEKKATTTFTIGSANVEVQAVFEKEETSTDKYTDKKSGIVVNDSQGMLPSGSTLVVNRITSGTDYDRLRNSSYGSGKRFIMYDIHFEDSNGEKVQPSGRVSVSIPIPSGWDKSNLMLVHYKDDGGAFSVSGQVSGSNYTFGVTSFSSFALVERTTSATTRQQVTTRQTVTTRSNSTVTTRTNGTVARTGDENNLTSWIVLLVIAAAVIGILLVFRKRQGAEK